MPESLPDSLPDSLPEPIPGPALAALGQALAQAGTPEASPPPRRLTLSEITGHVLPMAPEHLRRVLAAHPELPQGQAAPGNTRRFSPAETGALRAHFARAGSRRRAWHPPQGRPVIVTLAGPAGGSGRSVALANLAVRAALDGWRVLVVDGDPAGRLGARLGAEAGGAGGLTDIFARDCARRILALNAARLDRGDEPLPLGEDLAAALDRDGAALRRATPWPGLEVLPAGPDLLLADLALAGWMRAARGWTPWAALAAELGEALGEAGAPDLILCDTPRGLGPLALALLSAADVLLLPVGPGGAPAAGAALDAIGRALALAAAEARALARALGPRGAVAGPGGPRALAFLPQAGGASGLAAEGLARLAAVPGASLLSPLPALGPEGLPLFTDTAPGRAAELIWTAMDASWSGMARLLAPLRG